MRQRTVEQVRHLGHRMSWVDDKFEAMFKAFNQESDQSKWEKMCNEAQAYVAEQAPVIWLFTEPTLYGMSKRLSYQARPDGRVCLNLVLKGVTE
jgi:peptide/nickel transport system substrate-binding protein